MSETNSARKSSILTDSISKRSTTAKTFSFSSEQMDSFQAKVISQRAAEVNDLNNGFVVGKQIQPGPVGRGIMALHQTRFDLSNIPDENRDDIGVAFSGASPSRAHNQLTHSVADKLLGKMFQNVQRLRRDNFVRTLANMSGPGAPFSMKSDPTKAIDAESAKLTVGINKAKSPHYNQNKNAISLMMPEQLDQTSHELRHAYDQIGGVLDLHNSDHRIASELNAFTQQDTVARDLTGKAPANFEGNTPKQMAESYQGKVAKGYTGTLKSSLEAVRQWQRR